MSNYYRKELLASAAHIAAGTLVGDWVEVDNYNELYAWLNVTVFAARSDETLVVTIEREAGNTLGYTTLTTFTTIQTAAAASEEKLVVASLGGRLRYRAVLAGTWSSKSITFSIAMAAKCA